eukprot:TRINITY_DN21488_c0_g2_i1.p1 TRINITY_DN21488_c0_g2~~TRINITY_DN21488_c0_g2_i1.p1  ORF type:complete len:1567 (+),score=213.20 TRINITY_DN21488_c0_g2_i1:215-4915(+)
MTIDRGSAVLVVQAFSEFTPEEGYLILKPGASLVVEFVGYRGDEIGWLYGYEPGSALHGWFPQNAVVPLAATKDEPALSLASEAATASSEVQSAWNETSTESLCDVGAFNGDEVKSAEPSAPAQTNTSVTQLPQCATVVQQSVPKLSSVPSHDYSQLPPPGFAHRTPPAGLLHAARVGLAAASNLPMCSKAGELVDLVASHRVVVIDAATGSGKSTLVPLYLAEQAARLNRGCRVVVTQPRRLAAKGLATRVSQQCGTSVGTLVAGYRMGGGGRKDFGAAIVYVTAGHLLEALVHNPMHLSSFSHIVLDEVHERFVQADFLAALLRLLLSRPETINVRIVVMSATLQQSFGDFFRPLLLPAPGETIAGHLSLPGATPYRVTSLVWEEMKEQWPIVFGGGLKEPNFAELLPSKAKLLPPRRRSEQLTRLCKQLAPFCARLVCEICKGCKGCGIPAVSLVFLPGLDQMREVEDALKVGARQCGIDDVMEIYLMHSALEEKMYEKALEPFDKPVIRVVLATNIAESSLTVPGVNCVIDFGLHRVSVYDDDTRMSMLATEWCSKASMQQRRGRTGRVADGWYLRLVPQLLIDELPDFDESGVEKAPLSRVVLEAAHLAELLSEQQSVRTGVPVLVTDVAEDSEDAGFFGVAAHWDGPKGGWRVIPEQGVGGCAKTLPEASLQPVSLDARRVLGLLPSPPHEDRVGSAVLELHELGALCSDESPTTLGTAYLKLPLDVGLARLCVLGCLMEYACDAVILAAALSLSPSCDVFRTPFNARAEIGGNDLAQLKHTIQLRAFWDKGTLSEPLTLCNLCYDWLEKGGGSQGRIPAAVSWANAVNHRLWEQFTSKLAEITESLLRMLSPSNGESANLQNLLNVVRGNARWGTPSITWRRASARDLSALLTWGLAPLGFVAIGQTPALYGSAGGYSEFLKVVREQQETGCSDATVTGTLWWPKMLPAAAVDVVRVCRGNVSWKAGGGDGAAFVGYESRAESDSRERQHPSTLGSSAEILCRICGPFNGKETAVGNGSMMVNVKAPKHPCMLNWYMPRVDGAGVVEVRVNWKSQAETLIQVPRPFDKYARCRPKRILVASGGEYQSSGGRRAVHLRGSTVLPHEDGGRSAILWLLAAGQPRSGQIMTLAAPRSLDHAGDFEVRALRMWRRTLWLPPSETLTASDLRIVNRFRSGLVALARSRPHRLAGFWLREKSGEKYHIVCADATHATRKGPALEVSSGPKSRRMLLFPDTESTSLRWETLDGTVSCSEDQEGSKLVWANGECWIREGSSRESSEDVPALASLDMDGVACFVGAATELLNATRQVEDGDGDPDYRRAFPARLIPMVTTTSEFAQDSRKARTHAGGSPAASMAPFDLESLEVSMLEFAQQFTEEDAETDDGFVMDAEDDEDSDPDDDLPPSIAQEGVDEEFMWRLAQRPVWSPADCRNLTFVESSIAFPRSAICVECELEGKSFSKSQLARPIDERRCRDCVNKALLAGTNAPKKKVSAPVAASSRAPNVAAPVSVALATGAAATSMPTCSLCGERLTKQNCSAAQRAKAPSRRRCLVCVSKGAGGD